MFLEFRDSESFRFRPSFTLACRNLGMFQLISPSFTQQRGAIRPSQNWSNWIGIMIFWLASCIIAQFKHGLQSLQVWMQCRIFALSRKLIGCVRGVFRRHAPFPAKHKTLPLSVYAPILFSNPTAETSPKAKRLEIANKLKWMPRIWLQVWFHSTVWINEASVRRASSWISGSRNSREYSYCR